jgi:hypothetical protein
MDIYVFNLLKNYFIQNFISINFIIAKFLSLNFSANRNNFSKTISIVKMKLLLSISVEFSRVDLLSLTKFLDF